MNVTEDTKKHIELVRGQLLWCSSELEVRADTHDVSKLFSPEREMFEIFRPKLDAMDVESAEYKDALTQMGEGLKHHYAANRHHPEHFENGLNGMNLIDILEMVCDWKMAAARTGKQVNLAWACERFGISEGDHLVSIIRNTLKMLENA